MKPSHYNFIFPTDPSKKLIIYNSLTSALAELERPYMHLLNTPHFNYDALSADKKQFIDKLLQGGFILEDSIDELKILKFVHNSNKYDNADLALTIAPTLHCNFNCTYCYEQTNSKQVSRSNQAPYMPENIQLDLLHFIKQKAKILKNLFITWYGGEPLLCKDLIFDLSKKIIAIAQEYKVNYFANIITNGYLLTDDRDMLQKLKNSKIETFQITLDGPPDVHNTRRMLKNNNGPTFDRILKGIKLLAANDMEVSLRINIDKTNMAAAVKLLDILAASNLSGLIIYLGQVSADTAGCASIKDSCLTTKEFSVIKQTFCKILQQKGFKTSTSIDYPHIASPCGATRMNTFVVDPEGTIYKCWSEIGNRNSRIGTISDLSQRNEGDLMREVRWINWNPFDYDDCISCKILPICMGNCGYRAMFINNGPDCTEWKYNLEHYVHARFNYEKNKKIHKIYKNK
ncbi:MAG: AslB [Firmicutes bacterium]|nr:AslB [Bacillota bacterium]